MDGTCLPENCYNIQLYVKTLRYVAILSIKHSVFNKTDYRKNFIVYLTLMYWTVLQPTIFLLFTGGRGMKSGDAAMQ